MSSQLRTSAPSQAGASSFPPRPTLDYLEQTTALRHPFLHGVLPALTVTPQSIPGLGQRLSLQKVPGGAAACRSVCAARPALGFAFFPCWTPASDGVPLAAFPGMEHSGGERRSRLGPAS